MKPYSCLRMFINPKGDVEIIINVFNDPCTYSDELHEIIDLSGQLHPEQLAMIQRIFSSAPKMSKRSLTNWLHAHPFLQN